MIVHSTVWYLRHNNLYTVPSPSPWLRSTSSSTTSQAFLPTDKNWKKNKEHLYRRKEAYIYIYYLWRTSIFGTVYIFLGLARTRSSFQRDWVSILCLSSLSFTTISRYNFGRVYLIFLFFWKKIKFYSILLLHPFLALTVLLVEMGWLWWW